MVVVDLDLESILLPCVTCMLYVQVILHGKICKARKGEGENRRLKKSAFLTGDSFLLLNN